LRRIGICVFFGCFWRLPLLEQTLAPRKLRLSRPVRGGPTWQTASVPAPAADDRYRLLGRRSDAKAEPGRKLGRPAILQCGQCLTHRSATDPRARRSNTRAIRNRSGHMPGAYNRGRVYDSSAGPSSAPGRYDEAIRIDHSLRRPDNNGGALVGKGDIGRAFAIFKPAIKLNPGLACLMAIAGCYYRQRAMDECDCGTHRCRSGFRPDVPAYITAGNRLSASEQLDRAARPIMPK